MNRAEAESEELDGKVADLARQMAEERGLSCRSCESPLDEVETLLLLIPEDDEEPVEHVCESCRAENPEALAGFEVDGDNKVEFEEVLEEAREVLEDEIESERHYYTHAPWRV